MYSRVYIIYLYFICLATFLIKWDIMKCFGVSVFHKTMIVKVHCGLSIHVLHDSASYQFQRIEHVYFHQFID